MTRSTASAAAALAIALMIGGAGQVAAQECIDRAGEGTAPNRDAAMQAAYAAALRATDAALYRTWVDRNGKIGEAPGWTVRRMTAKCTATGSAQSCRVETTMCRG